MNHCILEGLDSFLGKLQEASEEIGISADHMVRTYSPRYTMESMTADETFLAVYLQDCTANTEEVQAGVMKTLSIRLGILRKISTVSNTSIDPVIENFENLQNYLTGFQRWDGENNHYIVRKITPSSIVDTDALDAALIVLCALDLEVEVFLSYTVE